MRVRLRGSTAIVLTLAIGLPPWAAAQEPPPAPAKEAGVVGSWEGWAKLTNESPGLTCRYDSGAEATTVHLEATGDAGRLSGSLAIDIPAAPGSGCPPLRKRYAIAEVSEGQGTVAFTDSGGNEWTLNVRRQGEVLQGLMAWREGGPEQPLAEGFTTRNGSRPLTRLSGEVRLRRAGAAAEGAQQAGGTAAEPAAGPKPKTTAGTHLKNLGIVLGANVVGLGLLYGVNKIGKGSGQSGTVSCSPRFCVYAAENPNLSQCECQPQTNILTGGSCGTTTAGIAQGARCDATRPCQAGLSCNSLVGVPTGTCEDNISGHCR